MNQRELTNGIKLLELAQHFLEQLQESSKVNEYLREMTDGKPAETAHDIHNIIRGIGFSLEDGVIDE